jgi:hypothetical protein
MDCDDLSLAGKLLTLLNELQLIAIESESGAAPTHNRYDHNSP